MEKSGDQNRKSRKINLLFHLLVLSLAFAIDFPHSVSVLGIPIELINYLVSRIFPLVVFYTCYFWLVPSFLAKKQFFSFFVLLFLLLNIITFLGYTILQLVHSLMDPAGLHYVYRLSMHLSGMLAMTVAAAFGTVFRIVTGWFNEMENARTLEKEKLRSELMLLKAQVNPHFLFNTLNNIDSLIWSDASGASSALIRLSSLLRYVIYDAVKDEVPLQLEIEHIEGYLDLQRLRYRRSDCIRFITSGDPEGKKIAPVLFMPFIENAFKHSLAEDIEKGMEVKMEVGESQLTFQCINFRSGIIHNSSGGFGIDNVIKRLDIQYSGRYILHTEVPDGRYIVTLKLTL